MVICFTSVKKERKILFSFTLNGVLIQKAIRTGQKLYFYLVLVAAIVILAILSDPNNADITMATRLLLGTIGGWTAVGVFVIIMYYNWGLFDRKRNARSSEYLADYVSELIAHNDKLSSAVEAQEKQVEIEIERQKVSKKTLNQLTSIVDQLGDTKSALNMLNVGLDKFLANATKSLVKLEAEMRQFQLGMIDRGIDRLTNLLIYSFQGMDKDKSRSLGGKELLAFVRKLQEYKLVQTIDDFIETFPISLDCDCGDDGEDLVDKIARSKYADNVSDKEGLKKALQSCNEDAEDPELVTAASKEAFFKVLFDNKIVKSKKGYLEKLHIVDTYVINEGMQALAEKLKNNGGKVLADYDDLVIQLAAKEAELKEKIPEEKKTTINLSDDMLVAAKRRRVESLE